MGNEIKKKRRSFRRENDTPNKRTISPIGESAKFEAEIKRNSESIGFEIN